MADHMAEDAVFKIFIKADIQRVWHELTKTDEAQGAIFNAWLHSSGALMPGAAIQMRTGSGQHVMVVGQVVTFEPPYRFVHTHRFTEFDDPECKVSYELKRVGEGVEVTMRLIGLPAGTRTGKSMTSGAPSILATLKLICETGRPALGTRLMHWMFGHMEFVLPKRTKTIHWPLHKP